MTPAALRARYRRGEETGLSVHQWRELFDDMARTLPVHRVLAARLIPEDNHPLDSATMQARLEDVQNDHVGEWLPLVVEGLPLAGPLHVQDGNHRAHAALQEGKRGLFLDVVIARQKKHPRLSLDDLGRHSARRRTVKRIMDGC